MNNARKLACACGGAGVCSVWVDRGSSVGVWWWRAEPDSPGVPALAADQLVPSSAGPCGPFRAPGLPQGLPPGSAPTPPAPAPAPCNQVFEVRLLSLLPFLRSARLGPAEGR